jgi:transcriptional antiterminator RfaH
MYNEEIWDQSCWYVIHTHARQEERAEGNLRAWGIETLNPKLKEPRYNQYTGEPVYRIKSLFPGYVFARFKLRNLYHKIRFTRGIDSLVSFDGHPTTVDDEIISIIRSRTNQDGFVQVGEQFNTGEKVIISEGPLKDFEGIFEREMKETDRVIVLLDTIGYQAHLDVEKRAVKKLSRSAANTA